MESALKFASPGTESDRAASRSPAARSTRCSAIRSISARSAQGTRYPGLHEAIIERASWDKTDALLHAHAGRPRGRRHKPMPSPLLGKLFDESGGPLTPSHAVKERVAIATTSPVV